LCSTNKLRTKGFIKIIAKLDDRNHIRNHEINYLFESIFVYDQAQSIIIL